MFGTYGGTDYLLRAGRDARTSVLGLWRCLGGRLDDITVDALETLAWIGEPFQVKHFEQQWERLVKLGVETEVARFRGSDEPFARTIWLDLPHTCDVVDHFLALGQVVYGPGTNTVIKIEDEARAKLLMSDAPRQVPIPYPDGPQVFWPAELRP